MGATAWLGFRQAGLPRVSVDLDRLDDRGLDALSFGVVQVDAAGIVHRFNPAQGLLSGVPPQEAIGRNLFREVMPGTHLPAFHGRFLDGVRAKHLDERFEFIFGFGSEPLLAEIAMQAAREPGRYWITVQPLGSLLPTRHRAAAEAANTVGRRLRSEALDPAVCEREPIQIPGAVQPHAVLLACDPAAGLAIRACSDNVGDLFAGAAPHSVIARPLGAVLPAGLADALRVAIDTGVLADPARPLRRTVRIGATRTAMVAHLYAGRLIVELERVAGHPDDFDTGTPAQAQDGVALLRAAASLTDAAGVAASAIRAITGFERVLVYRFDADWNGSAVAEDSVADWPASLLGLRFPASDIPAQARALYAKSVSRFVVDRDAVPSALRMDAATDRQAVDLTYAHARALSPVHLEYQRNLGVNGSMSVSILVDGRLWGLVIGHHRRAHYVTPETRALATLVTDAFALRMHELETVQHWVEQQVTLAAQNRLLEQMARSDDFVAALTEEAGPATTLADLFGCGGAVVVSRDRVVGLGAVPPVADLEALTVWLRQAVAPGRRVFAAEHLSGQYAPAAAWPGIASGLLAAFVGDTEDGRDHALLWFRPEVAADIAWGGDPNKTVLANGGTVLPRRSFERWVEERRGRAEPWAPWQVGTAEALAAAIEGVILRQGRRIVALEAKGAELTRALEQKDVLAREIDHRVKNSLQIVANVMLLQGRAVADPVAKAAFEDTYARVMSVARVHDSLQQSDDISSVDLGQTLRQLCGDLAAGMTGAQNRLDVQAEAGLMVSSQIAVALSLVATELVTNALKYAYAPGEAGGVEVMVKARVAGGIELRVCDSGRGLPADWSDRPRATAKGGGLGMRVIRAMLQQIGAEMEVGAHTPGACFTVRA